MHTVENGGPPLVAQGKVPVVQGGGVHKVEGGPQGLERKQDAEAKLGATE